MCTAMATDPFNAPFDASFNARKDARKDAPTDLRTDTRGAAADRLLGLRREAALSAGLGVALGGAVACAGLLLSGSLVLQIGRAHV